MFFLQVHVMHSTKQERSRRNLFWHRVKMTHLAILRFFKAHFQSISVRLFTQMAISQKVGEYELNLNALPKWPYLKQVGEYELNLSVKLKLKTCSLH